MSCEAQHYLKQHTAVSSYQNIVSRAATLWVRFSAGLSVDFSSSIWYQLGTFNESGECALYRPLWNMIEVPAKGPI